MHKILRIGETANSGEANGSMQQSYSMKMV